MTGVPRARRCAPAGTDARELQRGEGEHRLLRARQPHLLVEREERSAGSEVPGRDGVRVGGGTALPRRRHAVFRGGPGVLLVVVDALRDAALHIGWRLRGGALDAVPPWTMRSGHRRLLVRPRGPDASRRRVLRHEPRVRIRSLHVQPVRERARERALHLSVRGGVRRWRGGARGRHLPHRRTLCHRGPPCRLLPPEVLLGRRLPGGVRSDASVGALEARRVARWRLLLSTFAQRSIRGS
jgi:hypothetical protein